jgi:hypothetical protein
MARPQLAAYGDRARQVVDNDLYTEMLSKRAKDSIVSST